MNQKCLAPADGGHSIEDEGRPIEDGENPRWEIEFHIWDGGHPFSDGGDPRYRATPSAKILPLSPAGSWALKLRSDLCHNFLVGRKTHH